MAFRVAEFFAGVGLVRSAVERVGGEVVFANDIEPFKARMYLARFGARDFHLGDIARLHGDDVPAVDIATASFPCTDLSLAGKRAGLGGSASGLFWEFARILREMGERQPRAILIENVPSLATSNSGEDLRVLLQELEGLGYDVDLAIVDAAAFVPQSRPRLFIVGFPRGVDSVSPSRPLDGDPLRPGALGRFLAQHGDLSLRLREVDALPARSEDLCDVAEALSSDDPRWWEADRTQAFVESLAPLHLARLHDLVRASSTKRATAYRRTRSGHARWEIRADGLAGCLRTARGGSSRQALVEGEGGRVRVRWMTPVEYARLQGAGEYPVEAVSTNQALFSFGDGVCVPAVEWVLDQLLLPRLGTAQTLREAPLAYIA